MNMVHPLHANCQVANFQRCEHESGSSKVAEPGPSASGMSETAACPPPPIADNRSALPSPNSRPSSEGSEVKNLPARRETQVPSLGREDPLEKGIAMLQYSCLENSMDRGSWWTTVHGVAKNWT